MLTYALIGSGALALLVLVVQLFKIKVWIAVAEKRTKKMQSIGCLTPSDAYEVPEVHLLDKAKGVAIGRIKMGEGRDDNAYVEVLVTDPEDDTVKPKYRTYGYISQDGYIYKKTDGSKPEKIGYTARPSDPEAPTAVGERTWKTFWLKCSLNAYMGLPKDKSEAGPAFVNAESTVEEEEKNLKKKVKKEKKDRNKLKPMRIPVAVASYIGIHSSAKDAMPPEARAAAFGVFYDLYNKNDYREHYNSPAYGWKDTALPAAFIYAVIYVIWYIIQVKILGLRFIGYKFWMDAPLYLAYYAVWVIVRAIKIECIERSDTIQPRIDLFNKMLSQRGYDMLILGCCTVTMLFFRYYRFDFLPLAMAISSAVGINMALKPNSRPWKIINPYAPDEEEEIDEIAENPTGDIERQYEWALETDPDKKGRMELYFDSQYIRDLRFANPFFNQRNDKPLPTMIKEMFGYVDSHAGVSARSRFVAKRIKEIAAKNSIDTENDSLQFMLDFVQEPNIRYVLNRESDAILKFEDYIRFPDEVLYDKEGDSNSKAFLAAVLAHYSGYNVVFLYSRMQKYGAIGIEAKRNWIKDGTIFGQKMEDATFEYNGKTYIFCETSSDGFRIGGSLDGMRPSDFETKVEIPLISMEGDNSNAERKTSIYNWDLDERRGNKLHGSYTLEFDADEMKDLREKNPFVSYGMDGHHYLDNVSFIFDYIDREPERKRKVREIAAYIKRSVAEAGLDEAEMLQFALDFCQMPNINYKVDEFSSGINYNDVSKEYMRFPDEVLYDKEGDCDCKSSLTIALFRELGYKTLFMMSEKYGHAAVGVEYKPVIKDILGITADNVVKEHNGIEYLYCETTGDGFRLGEIKEGDTIQDFEQVLEIA
ncbi:MAG: hypothetical protein K2N48_06610 [Muribaculaceae bacterium]|nr:hypothetical protein [Muribaculaceae bacterium]